VLHRPIEATAFISTLASRRFQALPLVTVVKGVPPRCGLLRLVGRFRVPGRRTPTDKLTSVPRWRTYSNRFVRDRQPGLLFANKARRPLSQTNLLRRSLHPILKELEAEKAGFHPMRRFRTTWLRKQRAPEDFIRFWLGHSGTSVTDSYSKLADDLEFRKQVAEEVGTGFEVPAYEAKAMRSMRPRKSHEGTVALAA
jgi:Phage integrase family